MTLVQGEHYQLGKSRTRSCPRLRASSRPFVSDTSPKFILGRRRPGTRQSATYISSTRFIRKCARILLVDTWRCYRCLVAAWIMATWHRKKRYGYQFFLDRLRWVPSREYSSSFSFLVFTIFFLYQVSSWKLYKMTAADYEWQKKPWSFNIKACFVCAFHGNQFSKRTTPRIEAKRSDRRYINSRIIKDFK